MRQQHIYNQAIEDLTSAVEAFDRRVAELVGRDIATLRRTDAEIYMARKALQRCRLKFDSAIASIPASAGGSRGAA